MDCSIDSQGRTVIPAELREDAEIDKDVVVIGNGRKAEIWSASAWKEKEGDPKVKRAEIRKMLEESDIDFYG